MFKIRNFRVANVSMATLVTLILGIFSSISRAQLAGDGNLQKLKHQQLHQNELQLEEEENFHKKNVVKDMRILCNSQDITVDITTLTGSFNGMIYPKGLSKNSTCMKEYIELEGSVRYEIPLRSCNTMSTDVTGGVEYFNTIVVQPHRKLVTNQGRGYHVRCRYQRQEKALISDGNHSPIETKTLAVTTTMPGTNMKIYKGEPSDGFVAESVKIGDLLTLVVSIDHQEIYGMHVTDCLVRDGLGWSEQVLINDNGCPLDYEIMGPFEYSESKTTAYVHFYAHKFPYTSSVYYQCNVRLCIRHAGGCDDIPPVCNLQGENTLKRRYKRQTITQTDSDAESYDLGGEDLNVQVYSGHFVEPDSDSNDFVEEDVPSRVHTSDKICFPQKDFAIGMAIVGLILIVVVIIAVMILLSKRRRRKDLSTTGSSIYSGPYTNTAYSHSS